MKPKAYQEMKSALHRDLLSRIDLEKLNYLDDNQARSQILRSDPGSGVALQHSIECL